MWMFSWPGFLSSPLQQWVKTVRGWPVHVVDQSLPETAHLRRANQISSLVMATIVVAAQKSRKRQQISESSFNPKLILEFIHLLRSD